MDISKKFGTFGGVFTPALLTILSVIMYLRLGWIVGQAGLFYTIGIILVANIISVTTGLSLSSIATDKKVKAGGVYYMLSRSLGLSIGGAIGVTIYLAIGLSIALNVVGFAESFLSVSEVRSALMLETDLQSYRIVATSILIILTIIAFISTSLAIKTQYIVLTFIFLSFASIITGFFINTQFHPVNPILGPNYTAPSLAVLFAVFFPAATGFMMGASMSGDLKDPKKSIPLGTMLAIFTGLIINIGLAIGFAFFVNRDLLMHESAFLQRIATIPALVMAGIWGATLSTALGGILGGPRVIQAMAKDRLAPFFLSRGYGVNNEPHRAIFLTFIIAFCAILIGDLNTIARVATMFFITAYAFINLAFALESWASSDFRPSFKVPRWVGWVGFAASFIVMIQIDFAAMIIAFILIWATWFLMKKRQESTKQVDVWQSVYEKVVRFSLRKMNVIEPDERNWKPNIILFSGNPKTRPHLNELGKALISDHGLLTIINLQLYKSGQNTQPRFKQSIETEESKHQDGIFSREYYCHNYYDGIETLAETYGFAGVEPNTVLMGWAHQKTDPIRFARLIKHIIDLDLNIMLMDYDKIRGFGKRRIIDIWWRGSGNNGNLAINLVKFLWLSPQWKDSKTRLMIENPVNDERDNIYNFAQEVLDNLRVDAEIVIINNEIEKKPFYDIIRAESSESDIVFIGLPDIIEGKEIDFIESTHQLCIDLGTVVLIKASTQFKSLNIGLKPFRRFLPPTSISGPAPVPNDTSAIRWPRDKQLELILKDFHHQNEKFTSEFRNKAFGKIFKQYAEVLLSAESRVDKTYTILEKKLNSQEVSEQEAVTTLFKLTNNTFIRYEQILSDLKNNFLEQQQQSLKVFFQHFKNSVELSLQNLPQKIQITLDRQQLISKSQDTLKLRFFKWRKRLFNKKDINQPIKLRKLVARFYPHIWYSIQEKQWNKFADLCNQYFNEKQKTFKNFRDSLQTIESALRKKTFQLEEIEKERQKFQDLFSNLKRYLHHSGEMLIAIAEEHNIKAINKISEALDHVNINSIIPAQKPEKKFKPSHIQQFESYPAIWSYYQSFQLNHNILELVLASVDYKLWHFLQRADDDIKKIPDELQPDTLHRSLQRILDLVETGMRGEKIKKNTLPEHTYWHANIHRKVKEIEDFTIEKISSVISRVPAYAELLKTQNKGNLTALQDKYAEKEEVEVSRLIHFIVQSNLITPLQQYLRVFAQEMASIEKEVREMERLIKIAIAGEKEDMVHIPTSEFFNDLRHRTQHNMKRLQLLVVTADDKFHNLINKTSQQLSISVFLKTADNLSLFVKNNTARTDKESWLNARLKTANEFFRKYLTKIWYARSKRLIYAHHTQVQQTEKLLPVSELHALHEKITLPDTTLSQVPPYYQHLFLRKNNYFMDFWQGKGAELEEARRTIERHDKGFSGALLIRGEHNSGKSFLTNYICHEYLSNRHQYNIQAPFAGSAQEIDFLHALQKATEKRAQADVILNSIPEKSVIIIEDLELWWENNPSGFRVIQYIRSMIERFGSRVLFIININLHAFRSMNRLLHIDTFVLNVIDCHPFSAEELKNVILQRHRSGNLGFIWKNKKESEMRSWDYARLFNSYFNYSRGNVGLALHSWMLSIQSIKDKYIVISPPQRPDTVVLNKLKNDNLIFIVQFILHKRLNHDKMERIMLMSKAEIRDKVRELKRVALVIEPNPGVFILNPSVHLFLREKLIEKELL